MKKRILKLLKKGGLIPSNTSNALIGFFNAWMSVKVVREDPPELLISDKNVVLKIGTGSGGGTTDGWHWASPIEVNPSLAYVKGDVIHIQPTDGLVTVGIADAADPDGPLVQSHPGLWVALQAVPAALDDTWNVPQFPYPVSANIDSASNFWYWLSDESQCF